MQGDLIEDLDHAKNRSEESEHRGDTGDGTQYVHVVLHLVDFELGHVFDGSFDLLHRFPEAHQALLDHAGHRGVGVFTERLGGIDVAIVHVVADLIHEVHVDLGILLDGEIPFEEDIQGSDRQDRDGDQDRAAFFGHLPQRD